MTASEQIREQLESKRWIELTPDERRLLRILELRYSDPARMEAEAALNKAAASQGVTPQAPVSPAVTASILQLFFTTFLPKLLELLKGVKH